MPITKQDVARFGQSLSGTIGGFAEILKRNQRLSAIDQARQQAGPMSPEFLQYLLQSIPRSPEAAQAFQGAMAVQPKSQLINQERGALQQTLTDPVTGEVKFKQLKDPAPETLTPYQKESLGLQREGLDLRKQNTASLIKQREAMTTLRQAVGDVFIEKDGVLVGINPKAPTSQIQSARTNVSNNLAKNSTELRKAQGAVAYGLGDEEEVAQLKKNQAVYQRMFDLLNPNKKRGKEKQVKYSKTATNPKTGEKVGLNEETGQWENINQ